LKIALENIDLVLDLIRKAESPSDARMSLMKVVSLSEKQAQAAQEMDLNHARDRLKDLIGYFVVALLSKYIVFIRYSLYEKILS
jgi:hypothetical protein